MRTLLKAIEQTYQQLYDIIKEQDTFTVDLLKLPDYFTTICPNARLITIYGTPYLVSADCWPLIKQTSYDHRCLSLTSEANTS